MSLTFLATAALAASPAFLTFQDPPPAPEVPEDKDPVTTDSGLKYSVLTEGRPGPSPKLGDTVTVHYTGWLESGMVFDSSRKRGEPLQFKVGQVVDGWNEALQMMTPGARWKLTLPPELAYGEEGRQGRIPPNTTLIFDVELIDFTPGQTLPEMMPLKPPAYASTAAGLSFKPVEKSEEGVRPSNQEKVEVKYAIWTTDGRLLDCTEMSGNTIKGVVSQLQVPVLVEGLTLMKTGDRYQFLVPPEKGFGDRPQQGIPPGSTTVWQLELVRIIQPLPVPPFETPVAENQSDTDSGLKYEVLRPGEGPRPAPESAVSVHYAGWLENGTLFDSSFPTGEPAGFRLNQVISGWKEGLQLMQKGAIYRFEIPSDLAYGDQGAPPTIPPNATLVFYVELLDFN